MKSERYTGPVLMPQSSSDEVFRGEADNVEVVIGKPGTSMAQSLLDIINRQLALVDVVKMFESGRFDPDFEEKINVITLRRLIQEGDKLEDAVNKSLLPISQVDVKGTIPQQSAVVAVDAVKSQPLALDEVKDLIEPGTDNIPIDKDASPALVIIDNSESDGLEPTEVVDDPKIIAVVESPSDDEEVSLDEGPPEDMLIVDNDGDSLYDVKGGFLSGFGDLVKKGASAVLKGAASAIPGGALAYDAVNTLLAPKQSEPPDLGPPPPEVDNELIPRVASPPQNILKPEFSIPFRDYLSYPIGGRSGFEGCKPSMRIRPWSGGPAVVPGDRMTEEFAKHVVERRIAKYAAGGIDATTRLPFLIPLDDSLEIISSPVRDNAEFALLHAVLTNSIIRQSTREFRTQVISGTFSGSTLSLTADEDLPGSNASYKVPFFVLSFGLSELHGVRGGIVKFSMSIPQGLAVDGPLESRYELNEGYRLLETKSIIVKLQVTADGSRTGRLLLFPWTSQQAVVGYQPCFVRSNHDSDDSETGVDEIILSVSSAPDQTYVTMEVPGIEDPLMNEITDAVYTGLM